VGQNYQYGGLCAVLSGLLLAQGTLESVYTSAEITPHFAQ